MTKLTFDVELHRNQKENMAYRGKRMLLSDERVNSHGLRVLTDGCINLDEYRENPQHYYNHVRFHPKNKPMTIGFWEDIEVEGSRIYGVPVYDDEDKGLGAKVAGKYKRGMIKGASIGLVPIEFSHDSKYKLPGQEYPTVVKWRWLETSTTDIPSNKGCIIQLYDESGKELHLSDLGNKFKINQPSKKKKSNMDELKIIAQFLGLQSDATILDIQAEIGKLKSKADASKALEVQLSEFKQQEKDSRKARGEVLVAQAIKDQVITEAQGPHYISLFEADFKSTEQLLASMPKRITLSDVPKIEGSGSKAFTIDGMTFDELSQKNPTKLVELKEKDFNAFNQLFKAQYGRDYVKK
ncbi:MAG: hypothetical protein AAF242_00095 [Bacteroidota bacterium]